MSTVLAGNEIGQANYMSADYIRQYGHEPEVKQKLERQRIATRQAEIIDEIKAAYPGNKPVSFRMKNTGVILTQGFDHALEAICAGRAELVIP